MLPQLLHPSAHVTWLKRAEKSTSRHIHAHDNESYLTGKNGLQSTDDFLMKLNYEFVLRDPNNFLEISIQDDDKERSVEMCLLKVDPSQNANGNVQVVIIADIQHIQRWSERKIATAVRDGFFCNSLATQKHLLSWTY